MVVALQPDHVVIVLEENHSFSDVIGNRTAPYINELAERGALFTNFHAITHPSQPNYFGLFSGSTQGITDDGAHSLSALTLAGELASAGYSFVGYAEQGSPRKHNPWESFVQSRGLGREFAQFPTDFSKLPTVSFVSPNDDHNMHDGSVADGDRWLRDHLEAYADWASIHNSLLIVTFDEDGGGKANRVPMIVVGAGVGSCHNGQYLTHYSLLRAIEVTYSLPALGESAQASLLSLRCQAGAAPLAAGWSARSHGPALQK